MQIVEFYLRDLLPKYERMITILDSDCPGYGHMKAATIDVCNSINNLVDYLSRERPSYLESVWQVKSADKFRTKIEKSFFEIDGQNIPGYFFGIVRDVANCGKHLSIGRDNAKVRHIKEVRETIGIIQYKDKKGTYYSGRYFVTARQDDLRILPLDIIIYFIFMLFNKFAIDSGAIPFLPRNIKIRRKFSESRARCGHRQCEIFLDKADNLQLQMESYIYDSTSPLELRFLKLGDVFDHSIPIKIHVKDDVF